MIKIISILVFTFNIFITSCSNSIQNLETLNQQHVNSVEAAVYGEDNKIKARALFIEGAKTGIGWKYRTGGIGTDGTSDCSGLIVFCSKFCGHPIPRLSTKVMQTWPEPKKPLMADMPMFASSKNNPNRINHIGIWSTDEIPGNMIHAGSSTGVIETDATRWWIKDGRYKKTVRLPSF